ncbi:hypothetical protein [Phormidium nigroviride]
MPLLEYHLPLSFGNDRQLDVFRERSQEGYKSKLILADSMSISPLHFPEASFIVSEMLRPLTIA